MISNSDFEKAWFLYEGMEFKILGFKYSGALVGIAVFLYCVYGMIKK